MKGKQSLGSEELPLTRGHFRFEAETTTNLKMPRLGDEGMTAIEKLLITTDCMQRGIDGK